MPTILAGALKRMPGLPANVVAGVPRVEKDPRGGDVVIVPVRPYARETCFLIRVEFCMVLSRCARTRGRHGPVRQMWGAWPAVRPAGRAPLAALCLFNRKWAV